MDDIKGILCDVHGVLFVQPRPVPGSREAVARLRAAGFPHVFLTNSTQFSKAAILRTLREAGFPLEAHELLTAAQAAGEILTAEGVRRVGWLCVPELAQDLPGLVPVDPLGPDPDPVDVVLVGDMGSGFTFPVLDRAFRWLLDGARLVALARNRFYQGPQGLVLDSGPFVTLLEDAAGVRARVLGKPADVLFRAGLERLGLPSSQVAMVGDDLEGDILPAMELGLRGVLVRTGKYRDAHYHEAPVRADRVANDLAEVVHWLLDAAEGRERGAEPPAGGY